MMLFDVRADDARILFAFIGGAAAAERLFVAGLAALTEVWKISNKELQINDQINEKEVRVVGEDGEQLGIMSSSEAMKLAEEKNMDLVNIAPQAKPPVCKIIDYGKFRFEQAKRDKEARKKQKIVELKEIRLSLNIDKHDVETKKNHATKFLAEGNKVKVSIRFRGREMGHPEIGLEIMRQFAEEMSEAANIEKPAKLEGRQMLMFLTPKPVTAKPKAPKQESSAEPLETAPKKPKPADAVIKSRVEDKEAADKEE